MIIGIDIAASKQLAYAEVTHSERIPGYGLFDREDLQKLIFIEWSKADALAIERRHFQHQNPATLAKLEAVATEIKTYAEIVGIKVIEVASADWQKKIYHAKRRPKTSDYQWKKLKYSFFRMVFERALSYDLRQKVKGKTIKEDVIAAGCIGLHAMRRFKSQKGALNATNK